VYLPYNSSSQSPEIKILLHNHFTCLDALVLVGGHSKLVKMLKKTGMDGQDRAWCSAGFSVQWTKNSVEAVSTAMDGPRNVVGVLLGVLCFGMWAT
jgi:hypothetical protein